MPLRGEVGSCRPQDPPVKNRFLKYITRHSGFFCEREWKRLLAGSSKLMETLHNEKVFYEKITESKLPVLMQFWASWCKPCQIMTPVIEDIQNEYGKKMTVYRVDVDKCRDVITRFGVLSVPTIILFVDGEPALRILGFQTKHDLCRQMDDRLKAISGI